MPSRLRLRDWDPFYQRAAKIEGADAEIRAALSSHVPTIAARVWTEPNVMRHARSRMDRAALAGTRVRSSARSTTLRGATSPRIPVDPGAVEFGDGRRTRETYTRRYRGGQPHPVTRDTQAQLPERNRKGRVVFREGSEAIRRLMSAYAQTIVRTLHDLVEGK